MHWWLQSLEQLPLWGNHKFHSHALWRCCTVELLLIRCHTCSASHLCNGYAITNLLLLQVPSSCTGVLSLMLLLTCCHAYPTHHVCATITATALLLPQVPSSCTGVPAEALHPESAWADKKEFSEMLTKLGGMFLKNFEHFYDGDAFVGEAMAQRIMSGGPVLPEGAAGAALSPVKKLVAAQEKPAAACNEICNGVNGLAATSAC